MIIFHQFNNSCSKGLSLIELVVALGITSILLLGVSTIYSGSKRAYNITSEYAEIQENTRFALHTLTLNLRMAGFTGGCHIDSIKKGTLNSAGANFDYNARSVIQGHRSGDLWFGKPADILPDTDALVIRKGSSCSAEMTSSTTGSNINIATNNCDFQENDIIIITDCVDADIFNNTSTATGTVSTPGVLTKGTGSIVKEFEPEKSYVMKLEHITYFIKNNPAGFPSLYHQLMSGRPTLATELVPNIENIVINYGEDMNNDDSVDRVIDHTAVADWSRVLNLYVSFLARSDEVGTSDKPYTFNGVDYPGDKHVRKEFVTAINLRNRTP